MGDAHAMNCPYSSLQNDFEHEIVARPSRGSGIMLRFSVRLIPYRIKIAYDSVQVNAFIKTQPLFHLCESSKRCCTRRAIPRLFGRRRFHHRLRTLLLPHRRQPSCFHESHDLTSRVTVSVLPYQRGLPLRLSLPFRCMAMTNPPLLLTNEITPRGLLHQWGLRLAPVSSPFLPNPIKFVLRSRTQLFQQIKLQLT